jgi:hypothetical protein
MTNYEHYKDEIEETFVKNGSDTCGFVYRHVFTRGNCDGVDCNMCLKKLIEWAAQEYVEPKVDWSKVPIDTKILVRNTEEVPWNKRYFAGLSAAEKPLVWDNGNTSWTAAYDGGKSNWTHMKLYDEKENPHDH